jgi:membrane-associated phospholipid phosphatase
MQEIRKGMKTMHHIPVKEIVHKLNQILTGYYHYYGITDNIKSLYRFRHEVERSLFYWLNRRSQKNSFTWQGFMELQKSIPVSSTQNLCQGIWLITVG